MASKKKTTKKKAVVKKASSASSAKQRTRRKAKPKKLHLAQFLVHGPTYHSLAMWRHPRTTAGPMDWARPEYYQHVAKVCERGLFDMVFFADLNFISDTYTGTLDPAIRYAAQVPGHDPMPLLGWMAAVTKTIGLGATVSINHLHPFYMARLWASLDHLCRGRTAWNVVTSINHNDAANFGDEHLPVEQRYARAEEFLDVCNKLWTSWDEDALVLDREQGFFADPSKVHRIEHEGEFFRSRGPLNVVRSPQTGPAILQAGVSPRGRDFAARRADGIFAIQPDVRAAAEYYADIKGRVESLGRSPDSCKLLYGVQPIIGRSRDEALEKQAEHNEMVPVEGGLAMLSGHADVDFSTVDKNATVETSEVLANSRMARVFRTGDGEAITLAEAAKNHGRSVSLPQMTGTPEDVVDQMEDYATQVGGDGFMLSPIYIPGAIEEFVDQIVPELQRRGLYRERYTGTTARDHLRQDD